MHRQPTDCYVYLFRPFFFPPQMLINPLPLHIDPCSGGSYQPSVVSSTFLERPSILSLIASRGSVARYRLLDWWGSPSPTNYLILFFIC